MPLTEAEKRILANGKKLNEAYTKQHPQYGAYSLDHIHDPKLRGTKSDKAFKKAYDKDEKEKRKHG